MAGAAGAATVPPRWTAKSRRTHLGVQSLEAHAAYRRGLGSGDFDPEEFLEGISRQTGSRLGVKHAAGFEVFRLGLL